MSERISDIEVSIALKSPLEKVWDAVSDHRKFGEWFKVALDQPFVDGGESTGHITYPGYEHLKWHATVGRVAPESSLVLHWNHIDPDTSEPLDVDLTTRVEFRLEPDGDGTRLSITESGFDALGPERGRKIRDRNEGGWNQQVENIRSYVDG